MKFKMPGMLTMLLSILFGMYIVSELILFISWEYFLTPFNLRLSVIGAVIFLLIYFFGDKEVFI